MECGKAARIGDIRKCTGLYKYKYVDWKEIQKGN